MTNFAMPHRVTEGFLRARRRARKIIVQRLRSNPLYPLLYPAWWHALLIAGGPPTRCEQYLAAVPNPGAGIGHQIANTIAARWFAEKFGLGYAHIPFRDEEWELTLGFGNNERSIPQLKRAGYKLRTLPMFDEYNEKQVQRVEKIIRSYDGSRIAFLLERDQGYRDQYGPQEILKQRFYSYPARTKDPLIYNNDEFNIAVHIRRGDIVAKSGTPNPLYASRFQDVEYFANVLRLTIDNIAPTRKIHIYVFSQGVAENFALFHAYGSTTLCLDMPAIPSFLHMVHADVLITSRSSFSYKPALLSKGLKICPADFWHGYPVETDWIIANSDGSIEDSELRKLRAYDVNQAPHT